MSRIEPIELTRALVRRPSVTPADEGALDLVETALKALGFETHRLEFSEEGEARVDNLYARFGRGPPNFCFAGHTDVVPSGPPDAWTHPPFAAELVDGVVWGRGAADMKGAIAAFIAAAERVIAQEPPQGSISLLITGDEEGPAINGTKKVLGWMREHGERIDHCLVGEPSCLAELGDTLKIGRRGSMNCRLFVKGTQGHVAYPDRARNPIPALMKKLLTLSETPLDQGYDSFQPSSLQVTDIHVGNPAHNVIPGAAEARFNIRFNPNWTAASVEAFVREKLDAVARETELAYELKVACTGNAFLTRDEKFLDLIASAAERRTRRRPVHSTTGGTSDARFIRDFAPVAEFGLVGATIHQIDERAAVADIHALVDIYADILRRYFEGACAP
jgi:succinyl-diaminopimelate desuccinylase